MSDDKPAASSRMWEQVDIGDSKDEEEERPSDFHPQHASLRRATVAATILVPTDTDGVKALTDAGLKLVHLFPGDDAVAAVRCSDDGDLRAVRKITKTVVYYQEPEGLRCAIADCPYYSTADARLLRRVFAVGELDVPALDPEAIQAARARLGMLSGAPGGRAAIGATRACRQPPRARHNLHRQHI